MENGGYILVVEDSLTQARQLEKLLMPLGYRIETANNGKDALETIKNEKPLIVIGDILMPEMDGYALCQIIKAEEKLKDVPVVLLTQLSDPKEIVRGLECGADDFIIKPYNEELLLTRIKSVISLKLKRAPERRQALILVVEDSPTQAEQLKFLLEENGYAVTTASNGKQALASARKLRPTIIISDVLMPVMDGYELAYELKHDDELRGIPIILITSLMDRKEILRRASVVADGFFTKPYDDQYLLTKVESLISSERLNEEKDQALEVTFAGERYVINSGRRQILTFLLSTYENAVQQNRDLILMHRELQAMNEQLEERVLERAEQLRSSEAKYLTLIETNADAIVVTGKKGDIYFANRAARELFGLENGDIIGRPFAFAAVPGEITDVTVTRADGRISIAEMRVAETIWKNEKADISTFRDVTERKKMEVAVRESEENFRALAENANDGILIIADNGNIIYANKRIAGMTGYSVEELLNTGITTIAAAGTGPRAQQYESAITRKNGTCLQVEKAASRTLWRGENATMMIVRDIAERKKREEELMKASKLESLGTLAGGIAHDFNNLLTGVVGNVSLAKAIIDPEDKIYKLLADLEKASLRAKDLTQQLLTFAKGGAPVKKTISIKEILRDSAALMLSGSKIRCDFSIMPGLWHLDVDEGQISQVINNLIINAEQAMPGGGVINVSAENAVINASGNIPLPEGDYVKISIRDTGAGIPDKNLSKIFDPYFTTKKEGTGLGLATVYSIIKNHGGHITVRSVVGAGTAFDIYLPASEKETAAENNKMKEETVFGKGKILVMDDEEIVRDVAQSILVELGYEVDFAVDGAEAIELYRKAKESGSPFDAVIMDLTIPGGIGGKDAIRKLTEFDPGVKAIVSSGYSEDSIMSDYKKYGFSAVIAKPYRIADLSRTVHQVVTGKK